MEEIQRQAEESERDYDWLRAVESYKKALGLLPKDDFSKLALIHERSAYATYHSAFQAESNDEFRVRLRQATQSYEKTKELYAKLTEPVKKPRMLRCDAMFSYIRYWLASDILEKKKLLDESWNFAKRSLEGFEEMGNGPEYGKTYNQLSSSTIFIFARESDFKSRENVMREAVELGEKAIQLLIDSRDSSERARAYARTVVCLGVFGYYFKDVSQRERYHETGLSYWAKARELSEEVAMTELPYPVFGGQPVFGLEGTEEAIANLEKALEYSRKTGDKFTIGCALDWLIYHNAWKINAIEDPDEGIRTAEKILRYAEEAKHQFSIVSFVSPRGDLAWLGGIEVAYWMWLAGYETDLKKKRDLLERALKTLPSVREQVEASGYPEIRMYLLFADSGLQSQLSLSETNQVEKRRLLEKARSGFIDSIKIAEQLEPYLYWNRGSMGNALSNIESGLANLAEEPETKKTLLQDALAHREEAITLLVRELKFLERKGSATSLFAVLGGQYSSYGNLLVTLYELTSNKELLSKAVKAYEDSIETTQKLGLVAIVAQTYWKKAQVHDRLGDYVSAYQSFESARANYSFASEKIPQLRDFYRDQAVYMHAWSQIEKARQHHERQEYGLAEEHFGKASKLHEQLKKWNYLAPNYAAWAHTDHAEELSRKEKSEEAQRAFKMAAELFEQTRKSLQNQLETTEDLEEKQMIKDILEATVLRRQYCMARIAVEEARILDKKGDHYSSSEKYSFAAEILGKTADATRSERDKRELNLIKTLAQAWAKMMQAEAEENPSPYLEASQLFEKAKELSPNERAKTLALGHSRFCRALEAGMRFADIGDETLHAAAIQHLESAGKYYVKAGYPSVSEYAKATEMLLDAYSSIDNAKKETDPEKKTRLLAVAEKILQTSAGYFLKAEHPEKREQIMRLLEKVKEERELAQSINEVLHTPSITSTTATFATPTLSQENSVGLERFENANIQASIIARQKHLRVGENLELEIELLNAGKGPAQLIKITELVPSGFELAEKSELYRVEDSYLNMKGRRIDPLRTEGVKLVLRPMAQGTFSIKPTILYLDENGKYRSHEPEPVTVVVRELGIKSWLKGER